MFLENLYRLAATYNDYWFTFQINLKINIFVMNVLKHVPNMSETALPCRCLDKIPTRLRLPAIRNEWTQFSELKVH